MVGAGDTGSIPGRVCVWLGGLEKEKTLISVELVAKVEEEACRLARETAGGGQGKVGCDQERVNGFSVNVACDCFVVAGGALVLHDGAVVGSKPEKTEDSRVQGWGCGAQVVDGQKRFCDRLDFGDVEARGGSVADGDDGPGVKSSGRDEIVVRRRRVFGGAERTSVDDCALKGAS